MKNTCLFYIFISRFDGTSYKKNYKLQLPVPLFLVILHQVSHLELHSILSEKKDFRQNT